MILVDVLQVLEQDLPHELDRCRADDEEEQQQPLDAEVIAQS